MSKSLIAIAALSLAWLPLAKAGPDDDALIAQLKQIATHGQDSQTTAQVNDYIDQNKGAISALLDSATSYLQQQFQPQSGTDATAATANPPPQPAGTQAQTGDTATNPAPSGTGPQASSGLQPSGGLGSSAMQPSTGLQTSEVQPSTGLQASTTLQTGHLAGYPSLPSGDPITSVKALTADQAAYVAKVRSEDYDRKAELMASSGQ